MPKSEALGYFHFKTAAGQIIHCNVIYALTAEGQDVAADFPSFDRLVIFRGIEKIWITPVELGARPEGYVYE